MTFYFISHIRYCLLKLRSLKSYEFRDVIANGHRLEKNGLVRYTLSGHETAPGLGISISRKVGRAHIRNLLRRRIRGFCQRKGTDTFSGKMIVFIVRPRARALSRKAFYQTLNTLMSDM